jgi:hypothetical protein
MLGWLSGVTSRKFALETTSLLKNGPVAKSVE